VYVSLEEFKGLRPLERPGLTIAPDSAQFDNPLNAKQYEIRTGASGGAPRRILVGLDLLEHEVDYHASFYAACARGDSPRAMWLPAPPGAVGIKNALMAVKLGRPIERWFSQTRMADGPMKHRAFARVVSAAARWYGARIPPPEPTPAAEVGRVADWLAHQAASGRPAVLLTTPSAAVRTARAGRDLAGTLFVLVGEPYTEAKAAIVRQSGAIGAAHYAMVESGLLGLACHRPAAPDDVHLASDKIATIERPRSIGAAGVVVPALFHTTLLPASPKVMLNVESGDYGVREDRDCGCDVLPAAFRRHLHTIRSYEKLTSEGMHFLGGDLLELVESVLPAALGGTATDYQFVEREENGVARVRLVVSPSVAPFDSDRALRTVLDFLRGRGIGQQLMAEVWAQSGTLEINRRPPHVTPGGKIQPLQRLGS
jgi:hypothetical protein